MDCCPYCAEEISQTDEARCPKCGERLDREAPELPRRPVLVLVFAILDVVLGMVPIVGALAALGLTGGGMPVVGLVLAVAAPAIAGLVLMGIGVGLILLNAWARQAALVYSTLVSLLLLAVVVTFLVADGGMVLGQVEKLVFAAVYGLGVAYFVAQIVVLTRRSIARVFR
jgi:hypothetical protein